MFATNTAVDSELGALTSFRCFDFGVECSPDAPREVGAKENCVAREDSSYMHSVTGYARFLKGLKGPNIPIVFSVIAGSGPVVVGTDGVGPDLEPACGVDDGAGRVADPAIRLASMASQMGMPDPSSICEEVDLTSTAETVLSMMSGRCVSADARECRFGDVANLGLLDVQTIQKLPLCENAGSSEACVDVTLSSSSCVGSFAEVSVDRRGTTPPENTLVVASCPR
tara:strand:- start:130888 stop:131565 length:678 start_codon:yes stop_codon:yes gene_type:complete